MWARRSFLYLETRAGVDMGYIILFYLIFSYIKLFMVCPGRILLPTIRFVAAGLAQSRLYTLVF